MSSERLKGLAQLLEGELHTDTVMRTLYATDASAYREFPLAVAIPKNETDIVRLISFAQKERVSLIPRAAGTSLAGQVVGSGIVVDISRHFNQILEIRAEERWVRVQPGVVRDELNMVLRPFGLFFAPETSTANRAMIGGMVGNNSCGSNSVVYGSTREHLLEFRGYLSDGSAVHFKALSDQEFEQKATQTDTLEGRIYAKTRELLYDSRNAEEIRREYPHPSIRRRNTGYALDMLLRQRPFQEDGSLFNMCSLLAGSEGTLAFATELKLHLEPLPPEECGLLCGHFETIDEALRANVIAMRMKPSASELMDHYILDCTKESLEYSKYRFFVQGNPGAVLVVEFRRDTREEVEVLAQQLRQSWQQDHLGYHFPLLFAEDSKKVWALRKAGLGLLGNMPGDDKAVPVIEDTAVRVEDLPAYIREFNAILKKHQLYSVHYAHAGSGELHLRPIINLKTAEGNQLFRTIAQEIAVLVKKYQGSLSGEHGDGRLRGEFIRQMIGEHNYRLLQEIKDTWDPQHLLNPGKIVDTPSMNTMLRYEPGQGSVEIPTYFRFANQTVLQHAEQCNGSGDCRKSHLSGGTMCPSYMATKNEKDTTRARANMLREFLTHSEKPNRFDHPEIYEVLDLCLACKGCKSECPSNVDMAKLKMEFLQQYYDAHGAPFRNRLVGQFSRMTALASHTPGLYNWAVTTPWTSRLIKQLAGFSPRRSLPELQKRSLRKWLRQRPMVPAPAGSSRRQVYLFCDEFTNYNDTEVGIKAVRLLERLGYEVLVTEHPESGRAMLSKGFLKKARPIAEAQVRIFSALIGPQTPLIGLEPSAILAFRDEYPDLVAAPLREAAVALSKHVFLFEEFIALEFEQGRIRPGQFHQQAREIKLHGHCQQKALSNMALAQKALSIPANYQVRIIASGCCGMAGSFGYEKEHFDLSMQIGELVLFPQVRKAAPEALIAAPGTSCRHQIKDGTGKRALHPAEILFDALL